MLQGCEEQAELLGASDVVLVHDEQQQYREAFTYWWNGYHNAAPGRRIVYANGMERRESIVRLAKLEFPSSTSEIGIQIADVLAATLRYVLQHELAANSGEEILVKVLHDACMQRDINSPFPWFFGIPRWQRAMLSRLGLEPDSSLQA